MHVKKHLGFTALRAAMSECFRQIKDPRQAERVDYCLHDVLMSGFAMMFFQDPSLLAFQRRLQEKANTNNLFTLFEIGSIPKDTQMRDVIDSIATKVFGDIFSSFHNRLQRGRQLCRYHHQILQAVIVHPDIRQVIPLFPEPIQNNDGSTKQDCEINAGKRILGKIREAHPKLDLIITGDDLYSKQAFLDSLKENGMSYILVAKPSDHKILFEWVGEITAMGSAEHLQVIDKKGRCHKYHWVNDVPLNGSANADQVNFFQYWIIDKNGKTTYHNSWVSDLVVSKDNVQALVKGGRARWKIENETFNTLKNQGYHIEHNYGHGKQYLSMNFFVFNLLAFFVHQILELCDRSYQRCRSKFSSRKEYWNQLRCTFRIMLFRDFYHLLNYIFSPPLIRAP